MPPRVLAAGSVPTPAAIISRCSARHVDQATSAESRRTGGYLRSIVLNSESEPGTGTISSSSTGASVVVTQHCPGPNVTRTDIPLWNARRYTNRSTVVPGGMEASRIGGSRMVRTASAYHGTENESSSATEKYAAAIVSDRNTTARSALRARSRHPHSSIAATTIRTYVRYLPIIRALHAGSRYLWRCDVRRDFHRNVHGASCSHLVCCHVSGEASPLHGTRRSRISRKCNAVDSIPFRS